jgi:hypothetical protein
VARIVRALVATVAVAVTAMAAHAGAAHADPTTPQLTPLRGQREDAQRLTEQLRALDREQPPAPAPPPPPRAPDTPPGMSGGPRNDVMRGAGVILLSVSALTALATLTLYATAPPDNSLTSGPWDTTKTLFLTTSVLTGLAGLGLTIASRSVQISPTASPKTVGLAISGRL